MAGAPLADIESSVAVLDEAAALGAVGVAVGTSVAGRRLDEPAFSPFWSFVDDRALPVFVHPAFNDQHPALEDWYLQNVIGNPLETTIVAERLMSSGTLERHPGVRIVLAHGGGFLPYQLDRLRHASQVRAEFTSGPLDVCKLLERFSFDTVLHGGKALGFLVDTVSVERVLLGTDMPFDMGVYDPVARLESILTPADVRRIAEDNPADVFGLATRR
jgi:aminocarboxymuconate-semialdehyde decarboxylase